jgi:hypothetical protein
MRYEGALVLFGVALAVGVWLLATYRGLLARRRSMLAAHAELGAAGRGGGDASPADARRRYETALRDYRAARESFPTSLVAGALGFGAEPEGG